MPTNSRPLTAEEETVARQIADLLLNDERGALTLVEDAVVDSVGEPIGSEQTVVEDIRRATRANAVYWLRSFSANPDTPVHAKLDSDVIGVARETARWGLETLLPAGYRAAQDAMRRELTTAAFEVTQNRTVLETILQAADRSLGGFVTETVTALATLLEGESVSVKRDAQVRSLSLVNRVLSGAEVVPARVSAELRYDVEGSHVAAILWTNAQTADRSELRHAADQLARLAGSPRRLVLDASASSTWVWLHSERAPSVDDLQQVTAVLPGVRIALGSADKQLDGFRRSHDRAAETQKLMFASSAHRIVSYDEVELVLVVAANQVRFHEFRERVLGRLISGPPELRETLRVYIREQYSVSATARALFTHRNTVLARIRRAEELLPLPLSQQGISVGVALEVMHWLGDG